MQLVNSTPIVAELSVSEAEGEPARWAMVVAKATFRFSRSGVALDAVDPVPLYRKDVDTELGIRPADFLPRQDAAFEVIALAAAHSESGQPIRSRKVALQVGGA